MPRLPSPNHQSASEVPRDAIFSRRSQLAAAFPSGSARAPRLWAVRRSWARRPGWPPPVCSCRYFMPGQPHAVLHPDSWGAHLWADSVPVWIWLPEGFDRRRWRRKGGSWARSWETGFRILIRRLQIRHFPFENCSSHMAVGERSGGRVVCGAVESDVFFKARG